MAYGVYCPEVRVRLESEGSGHDVLMVPIPVVRFGFPTYGVVAPLFLPFTPLLTNGIGFRLSLEPPLPHRARMADPAPRPHHCPRAKQGPGDVDAVEPLLVQHGNSLFKVDHEP